MISLGNTEVSEIRVGAKVVQAVYNGSTKVWPEGALDSFIMTFTETEISTLSESERRGKFNVVGSSPETVLVSYYATLPAIGFGWAWYTEFLVGEIIMVTHITSGYTAYIDITTKTMYDNENYCAITDPSIELSTGFTWMEGENYLFTLVI